MRQRNLIAYCDGASRKDGRGGWGYAVYENQYEIRYDFGGETNTTNNRMELMAAIRCLRSFPTGTALTLYSDSKYVVDGILDHMDMWLMTNWRTGGNKPVKNQDLWEALALQDVNRVVDWRWVKGHTGVVGNERADQLAGMGIPSPPYTMTELEINGKKMGPGKLFLMRRP